MVLQKVILQNSAGSKCAVDTQNASVKITVFMGVIMVQVFKSANTIHAISKPCFFGGIYVRSAERVFNDVDSPCPCL